MEAKYEAGDIITIHARVQAVVIKKDGVSYDIETVAKDMLEPQWIGRVPEASVLNRVES